jgi:hypothetical protein
METRMTSRGIDNATCPERDFLDCFLQQIFHDARWMPKVQLERIVGPLLTPFIGRLMTKALRKHDKLRGTYRLICEEFPLLKDPDIKRNEGSGRDTLRSTNVDWLLHDIDSNTLLFLELKTNAENPRDEQLDRYLRVRRRGQGQNALIARTLRTDLEAICQAKVPNSANSRNIKYEHLSKKLAYTWPEVSDGCTVWIVYLGPTKIKTAFDRLEEEKKPDAVLSFHDLPDAIEGKHAECWSVIWEYLSTLDTPNYVSSVDMPTLCGLYE